MSDLIPTSVTRKKPVGGFSGVGTRIDNDGEIIWIVAANGEILLSQINELMPHADIGDETFQNVTIIQTQ